MSSIHIDALTENQLNQYLESRHSRTSGTLTQKRERLRRFLDLENQKQRRQERVYENTQVTLEDIRVADALCSLRNRQASDNIIAIMENNIQILVLLSQLGERVTALENDVMPGLIPLVHQDSNPQQEISESETLGISSTAP